MNIQENTEKVLRQLHILFASADIYEKDPNKVVINKKQAERILNELNRCVFEMLEAYELTAAGKEKAQRSVQRESEKIVQDAQQRAEDVYAASLIYSEDSLNRITKIMRETSLAMENLYQEMNEKIKDQERIVRDNQSELRSQLLIMKDTDKYMNLLRESKEEEKREELKARGIYRKPKNVYLRHDAEVAIDHELLKKMGIDTGETEVEDKGTKKKEKAAAGAESAAEEMETPISAGIHKIGKFFGALFEKDEDEEVSDEKVSDEKVTETGTTEDKGKIILTVVTEDSMTIENLSEDIETDSETVSSEDAKSENSDKIIKTEHFAEAEAEKNGENKAEQAETGEKPETAENSENTEKAETAETVENAEKAETAENVENAENAENAEGPEKKSETKEETGAEVSIQGK